MINIKSYGSGSQGNFYYLTTTHNNNTKIILECGLDIETTKNIFPKENILISDINACITSHHHIDHSCSINFFQEYNIPIFCTNETCDRYNMLYGRFNMPHILKNYKMFKIKELVFLPFNVEHGNAECFGFVIFDTIDNDTMLFITDFSNCKKDFNKYKIRQIYIECNYVDEYLENAILSDKNETNENNDFFSKKRKHQRQLNTHLSLKNLVEILRNINLSYCDEINLIHISEELGNRELMKQTIIEEFGVNCYTLLSNGDKI